MWYIGVTEGKIEKEGTMSFSIFIFIYTIHLAYLKVYTKFENTGSNRNREICDRSFFGEKEKWTNKGTDNQNDNQNVSVLLYTIQLISIKLRTKFQNPNSSSCWEIFDRTEKSGTEIFIGEKEKWTNKGTDNQNVSVLLLHNTTNHYQASYQISES